MEDNPRRETRASGCSIASSITLRLLPTTIKPRTYIYIYMRTHSRNFCQPVTNAIPSSFLLREGERKKRLQVFPRKGERKRTTFPRRWCGEIKRRIYIRTCIYIYTHTRATRQCLRSRFYEAACAASNERAPRPRRGHPGRSAKRRERKSRGAINRSRNGGSNRKTIIQLPRARN